MRLKLGKLDSRKLSILVMLLPVKNNCFSLGRSIFGNDVNEFLSSSIRVKEGRIELPKGVISSSLCSGKSKLLLALMVYSNGKFIMGRTLHRLESIFNP